jgi:hypothetical protein
MAKFIEHWIRTLYDYFLEFRGPQTDMDWKTRVFRHMFSKHRIFYNKCKLLKKGVGNTIMREPHELREPQFGHVYFTDRRVFSFTTLSHLTSKKNPFRNYQLYKCLLWSQSRFAQAEKSRAENRTVAVHLVASYFDRQQAM